jgi:hypothetical protein
VCEIYAGAHGHRQFYCSKFEVGFCVQIILLSGDFGSLVSDFRIGRSAHADEPLLELREDSSTACFFLLSLYSTLADHTPCSAEQRSRITTVGTRCAGLMPTATSFDKVELVKFATAWPEQSHDELR